MTEEQRTEISRLAASHDASERVRHLDYQNVSRDPGEARAQSVAYALARADAYEARGKLESALAALAGPHGGEVRQLAEALTRAPQREPA
jgi:hypothetical protein